MRRMLFFFTERLHVSRRERYAIALLGCLLVLYSALSFLVEETLRYDEAYYRELEQVFGERSRAVRAEHEEIWKRYLPFTDSGYATDSVSAGHSAGVMTGNPAALQVRQTDSVRVDLDDRAAPNPDPSVEGVNGSEMGEDRDRRIDINRAETAELQELPGIGPAYAAAIVQWREQYGAFTSVDQLTEIRGIGPARLEALLPLVRLSNRGTAGEKPAPDDSR